MWDPGETREPMGRGCKTKRGEPQGATGVASLDTLLGIEGLRTHKDYEVLKGNHRCANEDSLPECRQGAGSDARGVDVGSTGGN